jgi:DNA-binding protein HU-beta
MVAMLAQRSILSKAEAERQFNAVIEVLGEAIASGGAKIPGLGIFTVNARAERVGRNPRTGEPMTIAPSRSAAFRPAAALKARINR